MARRKTNGKEKSNGSGILSELLESRKKKTFTLSVDEETYAMVTRVAEQTRKTRPKILAAFVKAAYSDFVEEAQAAGVDFDPTAPLGGDYKGSRKKPKKNK